MSFHLFVFFTLIFQSLGNEETGRLSLIKFKESISNDSYLILDSWNSSTHFYNWHGVYCGHKHRRVTQLVLNRYQLSSPVCPFINNLSFLRVIILDNNHFYEEIPQKLGRLFLLHELHIQNNTLTGEFLINTKSCSNLKRLAFGGNHLIGKIPEEVRGEYTRRNRLVENFENIYVSLNKLSGVIPSTLYNLSSLTLLKFVLNQFNGSLLTNMFSNLPNLQILALRGNQFSGHIPTNLFKLHYACNCLCGK